MFANPDTFAILLAALAGGFSGRLLRVPGGALLMATVAVSLACNFLELSHAVPAELILIIQVLVGCMLGQSINRRFWQDFMTIWKPCLAVIFLYSALSVPFALLLIKLYGFDRISAILAATPARMQDMIILAGSMHLDAVMVMLMQLCRQFAIIGLTPFMLAGYARKPDRKSVPGDSRSKGFVPPDRRALKKTLTDYAILLIPAIAGGILGRHTGHVLGPLLGAFAAVAASRVIWLKAGLVAFPKPFAFIIQCLAGVLLGVRITPEVASLLLPRAAPLAAAVLFVLAAGLVISFILHRRFGWHKGLSWMAAAPGRASDMLAVSQDIELTGHERLALACVHTVRQVWFTLFVSAMVAFLH